MTSQETRATKLESHATKLAILYGTERSGTNVSGLMLNSHKDITCFLGVEFIFKYLKKIQASDKWTFDVAALRDDWVFQTYNLEILDSEDGKAIALNLVNQLRQRAKQNLVLGIHYELEKVAALFPDAKVIHLIRDPRDVAISCIGMGWAGNTYYAINGWLKTENDWDNFGPTLNINNVMTLFFENLISDPQEQLEKVCGFIGVPFSMDMLNYPNFSRYDPPDISRVQPWKKTVSSRDIALVEIRVKPLLVARHYKLSGYPLDPPRLKERFHLWWTNTTYKWKFGWHRYGALNFIMEKLTRKIARPFHPIFDRRMHEIWKRHLK
jgi:hypothetical protein